MSSKEINFLKELLIKLDVGIDAEHQKANGYGLQLIFGFTEEVRKSEVIKALNILNEEEKKINE